MRIRFAGVLVVAVCMTIWVASAAVASGVTLHVAKDGNDAWSGKIAKPRDGDGPFQTLERARDEIRKIKKTDGLPPGGVAVEIHAGDYALASPLELTRDDSGAEGSPIVYRAAKDEKVRLTGGVEVTNFHTIADPAVLVRLDPSARGKVFGADLKALGVRDLGEVVGGNRLEVFFQDRPMTLARWPNEGFVHIGKLVGGQPHEIHKIRGDKVGRFVYEGDRPSRWTGEKDVWLHGYWFWDWSDQRQQVESINTAKHIIAIKPPYHSYGYRKGQWYYALNLLSELDRPGEWHLDRTSGVLYFWPPVTLEKSKTLVSVIPAIVTMTDVSHVSLERLGMEACRGTAVQAKNADDVHVLGCDVRNVGSWAVALSGRNSTVEGCDIANCGDGGIKLDGGDRKTLTPGNLAADNNWIHNYGRWNRMYQSGVSMVGVGNRASHNLIHDAPHIAVFFAGNDHRIEYNEIHDVCRESNDAGAIYAGRDWSMRGNVVRRNFFHHISGIPLNSPGCVGVYLDDQFSSAEIVGNVFYKVSQAAFIGGGRDCTIANNLFVDCEPALHIDARGLNWSAPEFDTMRKSLEAMPYQSQLWASRYPKLPPILSDEPMAPKGNLIARNVCVGGRWNQGRDGIEDQARPYLTFRDNVIQDNLTPSDAAGQEPVGFVADPRTHWNPNSAASQIELFKLKDDSPAYKVGFERIPLEKIGLTRTH